VEQVAHQHPLAAPDLVAARVVSRELFGWRLRTASVPQDYFANKPGDFCDLQAFDQATDVRGLNVTGWVDSTRQCSNITPGAVCACQGAKAAGVRCS
jgi:hypothetical protein